MALRRTQEKSGQPARTAQSARFQMAQKGRPKFQRNRATAVSLPAPVGGWNARDSLADMAEDDAVTLINLVPATTSVLLRSGFSKWSTGYASQVETLMQYSGSTTNKLKAISGGEVFDATAGGAVGAAELTGLSNSRWQYINVATQAGTLSRCATAPITSTPTMGLLGRIRAEISPGSHPRTSSISTCTRTGFGSSRTGRSRRGTCRCSRLAGLRRR